MSFDFRIVGDIGVELYDSGVDSEVELIYLPGSMDPCIWKHQLRYFSNDYRVFSFKNKKNNRSSELATLKTLFKEYKINNAIIFSSWEGNITSTDLEDFQDRILGRVFVGDEMKLNKLSRSMEAKLSILNRFNHPKLVKKFLFSNNFDYREVKEFSRLIDFSSLDTYRSEKIRNLKNQELLRIEGDSFYDSRESSRSISGSGLFPFFEKPEEFNEVSVNYIKFLNQLRKDYRVSELERKNHSLQNYDQSESESFDKSLKKITRK